MSDRAIGVKMDVNLGFVRYILLSNFGPRNDLFEALIWNRPWWDLKTALGRGKIIWQSKL